MASVDALAQTRDGFLWLGTSIGLLRFDGFGFEPWPPTPGESLPSNRIRTLLAGSDGSLWIGTAKGISRLRDGRLVNYDSAQGLPDAPLIAMAEGPDGTIWAGAGGGKNGGLIAIRGSSVRVYRASDGLPDSNVLSLFTDSDRRLWVGTRNGLCLLRSSDPLQWETFSAKDVVSIAEEEPGLLALGNAASESVYRLHDGAIEATMVPHLMPKALMRDRDGNLWIGSLGHGLIRVRGNTVEPFTRKDGLSSDLVSALLEDREGNIWVGTAVGLDRLRNPVASSISSLDGLLVTAVYPSGDGVWVGTVGHGLFRARGWRSERVVAHLPSATISALYEDGSGKLWVGTTNGFGVLEKGRFSEVRGAEEPLLRTFAIAADQKGTIWVADGRQGLLRGNLQHAGKLSAVTLDRSDIYQLWAAPDGVLWAGFFRGGICRLAGDERKCYGPGDGLAPGPVQAFEYEDGTLWVGTAEGLSRLRHNRWTTWGRKEGLPEGGVQALTADQAGLWVLTAAGLRYLSFPELGLSGDGDPHYLSAAPLELNDGMRISGSSHMTNPRTCRSSDGELWLATEDGVVVVNPSRIQSDTSPPSVMIQRIAVDGKETVRGKAAGLAFRGKSLQINFTSLSLGSPESVLFRYRLDGVDSSWSQPGTDRRVLYASLSPKRYRFHVTARQSGGNWNSTPAVLDFDVQPYFYETYLFKGLCAVAMCMLVWMLHRARFQHVRQRMRAAYQERLRVTRELHDTLMQGFVGVTYHLDTAAQWLGNDPETGRQHLEKASEQAHRALREARVAISNLRLPALEDQSLAAALDIEAKRIIGGRPISIQLQVDERAHQLPFEVQGNLFVIAREAVSNAVNHGEPKRISVTLDAPASVFRLLVEDDGKGFSPEALVHREGHLGVLAMQERTRIIGAKFELESAPGKGTKLHVSGKARVHAVAAE
jgi:signal transduction histidine kinase/streptogramin lyase